MNHHLRKKLIRPLSDVERQILAEAGESSSFVNRAGQLPRLESMKSFVMLCSNSEFNNSDVFWKEYRTLSECLADTSRYYIHTPVPKRNGNGYRDICKVDKYLAYYQRRFKTYILDLIDARFTSGNAFAYKRGVSVCDNARPHAGHDYMVKMDIADFFDNTRQTNVYRIFDKYTKYNKEVKTILTKLVCHNGHLSQGACTSPQLANLALADFDKTVSHYCEALGITYTRYCDDMTFSCAQYFDANALIAFVTEQLAMNSYRPNTHKTRVFRKGSRHIVTGIVVNNETLRVPSEYKHALRQEVYYIKKYGITSHLEHRNLPEFGSIFSCPDKRHEGSYLHMLIGRTAFALGVNPQDKELISIRDSLYKCLDEYRSQFRDDIFKYLDEARSICDKHILNRQELRYPIYVKALDYKNGGLAVFVRFISNKSLDKNVCIHIKMNIQEREFPALKTHQVKFYDPDTFMFTIPVYEFAGSSSVINGCLDELLTIYSELKLKGYVR